MRDVAVAGILVVGEGAAGPGQGDAGLLAQLDDPGGAAVHHVDRDEVTAFGLGPGGDAAAVQFPVEGVDDRLEAGF